MRALPTNGKALAMAQPAIASEVHQALDVHRSLAAQVTFYGMVGVNGFADLQHFGVRKILNAAAMINAQLVCDLKGLGASNAMDVGERDNHALVGRDINARSEEHTSELQSLMRISYAVFCLKNKKRTNNTQHLNSHTHANTAITENTSYVPIQDETN